MNGNIKTGKLFLICGPSGVGKKTIISKLLEDKSLNLKLSVSFTSRNKRQNEVEGEDYFFISKEEFEDHIKRKNLVEYAQFFNNFYGTPKNFLEDNLRKGINVLLEIEVIGFKQVIEQYPNLVSIFLMPPSFESLRERLTQRNSETEEQIEMRLKKAKEEMIFAPQFDYRIVNDNLTLVVKEVKTIIKSNTINK